MFNSEKEDLKIKDIVTILQRLQVMTSTLGRPEIMYLVWCRIEVSKGVFLIEIL